MLQDRRVVSDHAIVLKRDELGKEDAKLAHDSDGHILSYVHPNQAVQSALELE